VHDLGFKIMDSEKLTCFDKAIEIDPDYAFTWNNKGVALELLGKYSESLKCFEKAEEIGYME